MYRIARNLWIDRYRSKKAAPPETSLDTPVGREGGKTMRLGDGIAASGRDPAEKAGARELVAEMKRAVDRLPEDQRLVFVMGHLQGMPYAQVSEILEIPEGTVKSRMHAAVRRLRGLLGRREDDLAG
jgi:RNA polymerase sigma-70 factor (ECF subfamily)